MQAERIEQDGQHAALSNWISSAWKSRYGVFLDGPIVLAGLTDEERMLPQSSLNPDALLISDRERSHSWWTPGDVHQMNIYEEPQPVSASLCRSGVDGKGFYEICLGRLKH